MHLKKEFSADVYAPTTTPWGRVLLEKPIAG